MSSMLGNIGARGAHALRPSSEKKIAKKAPAEKRGPLDAVSRDDQSNALLDALSEEEDREQPQLEPAPGHRPGLRRLEGEAFPPERGPRFADVDQGNLGDAWLLAACAAVAHATPRELLERVHKKSEGVFIVRLGDRTYTVTSELPLERYADPRPNGQADTLWVALIEKAFALEANGSYERLNHGNPARALEALTGKRARRVSCSERSKLDTLWRELSATKTAVVLKTRDRDVSQPLHPDHAYAVIGAGARALRLYNPWGTKQNTRSLESMIHEVSLENLRFDAEAFYIAGGK